MMRWADEEEFDAPHGEVKLMVGGEGEVFVSILKLSHKKEQQKQ